MALQTQREFRRWKLPLDRVKDWTPSIQGGEDECARCQSSRIDRVFETYGERQVGPVKQELLDKKKSEVGILGGRFHWKSNARPKKVLSSACAVV